MLYMFASGISKVTSALLSNAIGADNLPLARRFFRVIYCSSLASLLLIALCFYTTKSHIAAIFTSEDDIKDSAVNSLMIISFFVVFDGI